MKNRMSNEHPGFPEHRSQNVYENPRTSTHSTFLRLGFVHVPVLMRYISVPIPPLCTLMPCAALRTAVGHYIVPDSTVLMHASGARARRFTNKPR